METVTHIFQIIYYIAMSIAGPLAVIAYIKVKKTERLEKEYRTYDELDNRFFSSIRNSPWSITIWTFSTFPTTTLCWRSIRNANRKWWLMRSCFPCSNEPT